MLRWSKKASENPDSRPEPTPPSQSAAQPAGSAPHPPAAGQPPTPEAEPAKRKSLARLLLEAGKVPEDALRRAIQKQKETGEFLGEILEQEGLLDQLSLTSFLAKHCKIPHLSLLDYLVDKELLALVPEEICQRYRVLPMDKLGRNLTVAMVNPLNTRALEEIQARNPDLRIKPILCAYQHYQTVSRRLFGAGEKPGEPESLTASSLGLLTAEERAQLAAAAAKPPAPEAPAPESAPAPVSDGEEEDIPDAVEVDDEAFDADEALQDAVAHAENTPAVGGTDSSEAADPAEEEPPEELRQVVGAMMDSVRDTYTMLARRLTLFNGVRPEDVARIFSKGVTREYKTGETVFESGVPGDEMFVILGGSVEIYEGERTITTLERGAMFGEMALLSDQPRSAAARALEHSSLLVLSNATLREDLAPNVTIQLLLNIIITLSDRLRTVTGQDSAEKPHT